MPDQLARFRHCGVIGGRARRGTAVDEVLQLRRALHVLVALGSQRL